MAYWLAWEEPRAVGDLVHVEKFFARNLGGLTRARTRAGPAREGRSRTPSMYADEKSDEVVVLRKRSNKGRQLLAEVVEGRRWHPFASKKHLNLHRHIILLIRFYRGQYEPASGRVPSCRALTTGESSVRF